MRTDVLIVGGGPAGCAAAITLARQGCPIILVEQALQPQHKVCGEFLSQEALDYLRSLGINLTALGAVPIDTVRLAGACGSSEARLPFPAMSLTRRRLDAELLLTAEHAGARILRGYRVQAFDQEEVRWTARLEGGESITAAAVYLATGKHDVHGRSRTKGKQADLVALKMYWRLAPRQAAALQGHVELMMYRGGYAGLQPVEEGAANLCCLIRRTELQRLGGRWEALLAAMQRDCGLLRERLQGAEPLLVKPLAIAPIPYGYMRAVSDGIWALGDQAAVIPSFTGDGMSIALHSGCLAADMYLRGQTSDQFQLQLRRELSRQVALATWLSQGFVRRPFQQIFTMAAGLWPGMLQLAARHTRIPNAAIRSA